MASICQLRGVFILNTSKIEDVMILILMGGMEDMRLTVGMDGRLRDNSANLFAEASSRVGGIMEKLKDDSKGDGSLA